MKEMQDTGIIVTAQEMHQLLEDPKIREWLEGVECLQYPGEQVEFGIPLPPISPRLPGFASTPMGEEFLKLAAPRQP